MNTISGYREIEEKLFSTLENINGAPYDNKARLYEKLVSSEMYNKLMWGTQPADYVDFAKMALLKSAGMSLDIGCGGLIQTAPIYATIKHAYILLDQSMEMLRIAKERLISLCNTMPNNIDFLQADAFHLPFTDERFDNIVSFGMIHCFENKLQFINEALRVLKPGGNFYFSCMTSNRLISKWYMNLLRKQKEFGVPNSSSEILQLFTENGCKVEHYLKGSMIFISGTK